MNKALIGGVRWQEGDDVDRIILDVMGALKADGLQPVGVVQRNADNGADHCDGVGVEFVTSGRLMGISQDLGPDALGCRLDTGKLAKIAGLVSEEINGAADLLVLNRFGKSEADGGGLIDCASSAIAADIPVLIPISPKHIDAWHSYHGGLGVDINPTNEAIYSWCRSVMPAPGSDRSD